MQAEFLGIAILKIMPLIVGLWRLQLLLWDQALGHLIQIHSCVFFKHRDIHGVVARPPPLCSPKSA